MPPLYGIQPSFAGGEFAPSLWARVDLAKYASGARTLLNFLVHAHGGASNRSGLRYIATVKYPTKRVRTVPFEFSTEQAYVIEFGDKYCRFYMDQGQILSGGIPYEIVTPYLEADLPKLKFAQSADVLYICHPDYAPRTLERASHTSWTLALYQYSGGPFMPSNVTAITITPSGTTGAITLTASAPYFTPDMVGALFELHQSVPGSAISQSFSATGTSASIKCGSNWRIITHGTWTAKFRIEQSSDNGATWTELRTFAGANDFNANTFGEVDDTVLIRLNVFNYTSGTINIDLTSDPYEETGIVRITAYTSSTVVSATVVGTPLGTTAATSEWSEGSWSEANGWPSCCTFFEDRLCFASTPEEPQTIWMTETGDYNSFARSDPLVDSDGITINIPSRKMNAIKDLLPLKTILALTSASEWLVGPGADGVLTPTSVITEINGYRGCNDAVPVIVGNQAIFVQPKGSVVRDLGYEFSSQGFAGNNISIISNHLFTNYEIMDLAYQQEPDSLVWAVRSDGRFLSMTYLREHEVIAWTHHETDGEIETICSIPGDTYDEVWVAVKRGNTRFIELLTERMRSTDPRKQFFVDAGISYDSPKLITGITTANPAVVTSTAHGFTNGQKIDILEVEGAINPGDEDTLAGALNGPRFTVRNVTVNTFTLEDEQGHAISTIGLKAYKADGEARLVVSTISGLGHLEGRTVAGLADGNIMVPKVVTGGSITLDTPASLVHVGLPYTCDLETLNAELSLRDGTTQGRKVRAAAVTIRFLNSRGGYVGPDGEHLHEIIQRTSEPLGSPIELFNGDHKLNISGTFDEGGRIFYRQTAPLPVSILAVMPVYSFGG